MSKRASIVIIILALILGTGVLYFLLRGGGATIVTDIFGGSPFGNAPSGEPTGGESGGTSSGETGSQTNRPLPKFFKLSDAPIAGAVSFIKNGSTYVRYVDRATGHIYDINPATLERVKIWNTTSPRVYEVAWKPDGSGFVSRTVPVNGEVVTNVSMALTPPKATSTSAVFTALATPLRGVMGDIAVLDDGSLVYNLTDTGSVVTSSFTGDKPRNLLSLAFTNWRILPMGKDNALLITKASSSAAGYAYVLNSKTGSFSKVLGPLMGLLVLPSHDGKQLAYASREGFSALNLASKITTTIAPQTLPEKCVWSKKSSGILLCGVPDNGLGADSPDSWYQGVTHYSDRIWRFNADTGTAEVLLEPKKDFNTDVDVAKPLLSPDEDYLFITNKNDLSLWALKLQP